MGTGRGGHLVYYFGAMERKTQELAAGGKLCTTFALLRAYLRAMRSLGCGGAL